MDKKIIIILLQKFTYVNLCEILSHKRWLLLSIKSSSLSLCNHQVVVSFLHICFQVLDMKKKWKFNDRKISRNDNARYWVFVHEFAESLISA